MEAAHTTNTKVAFKLATTMARPGLGGLKKTNSMKTYSKTFVVATDGSAIGKRALRLAIAIRGPVDKIKVVTVKTDGGDETAILRECDAIYQTEGSMACGKNIGGASIGEVLAREAGADLTTVLRRATEAVFNPVLVMGAAGRNAENAAASAGSRPSGQAKMGSIAEDCMLKVQCPVILVKAKGFDCLSNKDELALRAKHKPPESISVKPPVFVICVDGTPVSTKGADIASTFAVAPSDTLTLFHVINSDRDAGKGAAGTPRSSSASAVVGTPAIEKYYSGMASKFQTTKPGVTSSFVKRPLKNSIKEVICNYIEEDDVVADLLVLGSAELANAETPGTFGSIAAATAKKAPCSVMVIKEAFNYNVRE